MEGWKTQEGPKNLQVVDTINNFLYNKVRGKTNVRHRSVKSIKKGNQKLR